ncbi:hypothetical protein QBC41DRAFT_377485 [Cercophora samala]|uniref:C2H2-type domain-containing protein n=1 Tax=Cercophora samala TaxID=330535 RepID=A0AA40D1U4_9PEZI|nr:hypothetical protein QBC41DRAFT_377485 [Cercophora samala]
MENTKMKAILCDCGKRVANPQALKQHKLDSPNHSGVSCDCGARFITAEARDQHRRDSSLHAQQGDSQEATPQNSNTNNPDPAAPAKNVPTVPPKAAIPPTPEIKPPTETKAETSSFQCCNRKFKSEKDMLQHQQDSPLHAQIGHSQKATSENPNTHNQQPAAPAQNTPTVPPKAATPPTPEIKEIKAETSSFQCCNRKFKSEKDMLQHQQDAPLHAQMGHSQEATSQNSNTHNQQPAAPIVQNIPTAPPKATTATAASAPEIKEAKAETSSFQCCDKKFKSKKDMLRHQADSPRHGEGAKKKKAAGAAAAAAPKKKSTYRATSSSYYRNGLDFGACDKDCAWCGNCMRGLNI